MEWEYMKATDYCDSVRDGTHDTPKPTETGYKLVTGKHIKNGVIDPSDAYYISEKDYRKINERSLVEQWDVLMSMIGTVGEVAVVENKPDYAIKNVALFKCGGSELKGRWLSYYLKSPEAKGHMTGHQKGSSQQFLSLTQLRDLPVAVTDDTSMREIIKRLSCFDELIEVNNQQINLLEELLGRTYKEWFLDFHFPGSENTKRQNDDLPYGWKRDRADQFFDITIGKTPPRAEKQWFVNGDKGVAWASISDMGDSGTFIFKTNEGLTSDAVEKHNMKVVPSGTVLLSFKLTVGRVSITTKPMCTNEAIAHFRIESSFLREYTYSYLKAFKYDTLGNTSSISKAVNSKIIKAMPFVMPDDNVLIAFSKSMGPVLDEINTKQLEVINLIEARDRLLNKLMSGEIEL